MADASLAGATTIDNTIKVTHRGNAVGDDPSMTLPLTFSADVCEEANGMTFAPKTPTYVIDVYLDKFGVDQTAEYSITGFTPSLCLPQKYQLGAFPADLQGLVDSGHLVFETNAVRETGKITVKKDFPYAKAGTYTFTARPYSTGLATLLGTDYVGTVNLVLHHACEIATATLQEDKRFTEQEYTVGITKPIHLLWHAYAFAPSDPCNDGSTIQFPDNYTGTWRRIVPDPENEGKFVEDALTVAQMLKPPIKVTETDDDDKKKQWTIDTACDDCRGVYEVTLTANYNKVDLVASQTFKLTIIDQCEPSKFTVPAAVSGVEWKWHIADTEETFMLPKIATVPARCEITYAVTIPKALKDVATYDKKGGLVLTG